MSVSMPIDWDELADLKGSDHWTIRNVGGRLDNLKNDPWKQYADTRQSLSRAARRLDVNLEND